MKPSRISASVVLAASLVLAPVASAAVDAYLQLGDVKGESKDPAHRDWIELLSMNFVSAAGSAGASGRPGRRVVRRDLHIVKAYDKSSPVLAMANLNGRTFPKATIEARGVRYVLTNVMVSGIQTSAAGAGDAVPHETVSLNFENLEESGGLTIPTHVPTKPPLAAIQAAPAAAAMAAMPAPKITGASATAPFLGLSATLTIASTGPCQDAFVDWGDGSIAEGHTLTGKSTVLPAHTYATAGAKTIKVGGRDAPYWPQAPQKAPPQKGANPCTGWAPEVHVTLRSDAVAAPALKRN